MGRYKDLRGIIYTVCSIGLAHSRHSTYDINYYHFWVVSEVPATLEDGLLLGDRGRASLTQLLSEPTTPSVNIH